MDVRDLLEKGIAALKAGRNTEARRLLTQVVEQDERNETAWLWLSGAVETDGERQACLEKVLSINPNNQVAVWGIEKLRKRGSRPDSLPNARHEDKGKSRQQPVRPYAVFEKKKDHKVPLLELMEDMPGHSSKVQSVLSEFERRYHHLLPAEAFETLSSGREIRWHKQVQWARFYLANLGFMDSPARGMWRIAPQGLQWLKDNPTKTHIEQNSSTPRQSPKQQKRKQASDLGESVTFRVAEQQFSLTVEQVLDVARRAIADGLPPEAERYHRWAVVIDGQRVGLKWLFSQITGLQRGFTPYYARDVLERRMGLTVVKVTDTNKAPRSKPATRTADTEEEHHWSEVVRQEVKLVRDFLRGRADRPSDEHLCDLVQLCYTLGLYREGRDLFALVDVGAVHIWFYERTRKLATICALRADA